jgi:hypothetical protein
MESVSPINLYNKEAAAYIFQAKRQCFSSHGTIKPGPAAGIIYQTRREVSEHWPQSRNKDISYWGTMIVFLGSLLTKLHRDQETVELLGSLIEEDGILHRLPSAHNTWAKALSYSDHAAAVAHMTKYLENDGLLSAEASSHATLVGMYIGKKNFAAALAYLSPHIQEGGILHRDSVAYLYLAIIYIETGQLEAADQFLQDNLQIDEPLHNTHRAYVLYGQVCKGLGKGTGASPHRNFITRRNSGDAPEVT